MNRGRLFAQIEHVERVHGRGLGRPPPKIGRPSPPTPTVQTTARDRAEQLFRPSPREGSGTTLTASPAMQVEAKGATRSDLTTVVRPPGRDPKNGAVKLAAKALKVTLVLDPAVVGQIELPPGAPAPPLVVEVGDRRVKVQVNTKGLRKALATIAEHGADKVVVMLQGKLEVGDVLTEAGIVAQVKASTSRSGLQLETKVDGG